MKQYYPILLSKAGEFGALSNLSDEIRMKTSPIIQVLNGNYERVKTLGTNVWNFNNNELFLDFSLTDTHVRDKRDLIDYLYGVHVNVVPVIKHNDLPGYKRLLKALIEDEIIKHICVRFTNPYDINEINRVLLNFVDFFSIDKGDIFILLDFGYVDSRTSKIISSLLVALLSEIEDKDLYRSIIIASGSFPENLAAFRVTGPRDNPNVISRYEWEIWEAIKRCNSFSQNIKYSDFGTKYPYYSEAPYAGTCSIKYSIRDSFVIYRGELSKNHPLGNGQYIEFSRRLVEERYFSGEDFSWGDNQIYLYSERDSATDKPGNAQRWVEISQNHHITLIHSLL